MTALKRNFNLSMDLDLAKALYQYMEAQDCANLPEAARQAIRIGLASTPTDGALYAVRVRAYNEVRVWTLNQIRSSLVEVAKLLEETIGPKPT